MNIFLNNKRFKDKNLKDFDVLSKSFLGGIIKKGHNKSAFSDYINFLEYLKLNYEFEEITPHEFFIFHLSKLKPIVGIRIKRVAGINYQLPCPISDLRSSKIAVKWFLQALTNRGEKTFLSKLKGEALDLIKEKGLSLQRKSLHEKNILENRAYMHFLKKN